MSSQIKNNATLNNNYKDENSYRYSVRGEEIDREKER